MKDTLYAVVAPNSLVPVVESTSLLQCRIVQQNNPESTVAIVARGAYWGIDDTALFAEKSFEFNRFVVAYHDYLTWVICFNDKARWG